MKLIEAEAVGPVEGEEAIVTPPRPPHRRVSVSLVFTLTVLIGTVVAIFLVFPARHEVFLSEALARHRTQPAWDLATPTGAEARAWATGLVGAKAPLPVLDANVKVIGVSRIELLDRPAALLRLAIGPDEVTYIVQPSRGIAKKADQRTAGDLRAVSVRRDGYSAAAAGPAATADRWLASIPH